MCAAEEYKWHPSYAAFPALNTWIFTAVGDSLKVILEKREYHISEVTSENYTADHLNQLFRIFVKCTGNPESTYFVTVEGGQYIVTSSHTQYIPKGVKVNSPFTSLPDNDSRFKR